MENVLVVSPHPDDSEYSCFGTLRKIRDQVSKIVVYSATCGGPNDLTGGKHRIGESRGALGLIPIDNSEYGIRYGLSSSDYANICYELDVLISDHHIDTIFSPHSPDSNQDHRMMSEVVLSAARRKKLSIINYNGLSALDFLPNLWVDITEFFDLKLSALAFLASQLDKDWMQPEYIEMFNQDMHSKMLGYKYSERFVIKRCFL